MTSIAFRLRATPPLLALALGLAAAFLFWRLAAPFVGTPAAEGYDIARMVFRYSVLPRLATALLCGAALSLSGALFQQILRNPMASPTTLGISAGANLALVVATLFVPALIGGGRDMVALAGSAAVALLVMGLGARRGFSPFSLVLSGLVVSLWCGALAAILTLLNDRYLVSLFIWGAGSLAQQGWDVPLALLWKVGGLAALAALVVRPLSVLELGDESASSLGVRLARLRLLAVAIAVALSAVVTSAVGVVGFIGLVAPILARLAGARRTAGILIWSTVIGAALLLVTDTAVQLLAGEMGEFLPTGAVTAVFGSPLMLVLLGRLKIRQRPLPGVAAGKRTPLPRGRMLLLLAAGIFATAVLALCVGRGLDGHWTFLGEIATAEVLELRLSRILAALSAGIMLAIAGVILQRMTGNEMASPEVLGVSAGATFGVTVAIFATAAPGLFLQVGFAAAGALLVLAVIFAFATRSGLAPERILLAGIALSAMVDAVVGVLNAGGDPRALLVLRWMSGSTYAVDNATVVVVTVSALLALGAAVLACRWLDLLPLGASQAAALGVTPFHARLVLFLMAGVMSAVATLCVGPLSFIGLMGPHLAREAGFRRALPQVLAAAAIGGACMVAADWVGRTVAFPYQIPAGLVSALIGAPFLMMLLRKKA